MDTTPLLDRAQLREVTMYDEDLMREVLTALIDDTSQQLPRLAAAIDHKDADSCARVAHYCKGACANVGAKRAASLLQQMERNAIVGAFGLCSESLQLLAGELELLRQETI